jgi:hypothetical protein
VRTSNRISEILMILNKNFVNYKFVLHPFQIISRFDFFDTSILLYI